MANGIISSVQDVLDLAEKLKCSNPNQRVIFVDSDFNEYNICSEISLTCVGDALGRDYDEMVDNGEDYFEDCISIEVQ